MKEQLFNLSRKQVKSNKRYPDLERCVLPWYRCVRNNIVNKSVREKTKLKNTWNQSF